MNDTEQTQFNAEVQRYNSLIHAMQTGVKFSHEHGSTDGSPKHLRVGVNSAMCEAGAILHLLIEKGILTKLEYVQALNAKLEQEVNNYRQIVSDTTGTPLDKVTLA